MYILFFGNKRSKNSCQGIHSFIKKQRIRSAYFIFNNVFLFIINRILIPVFASSSPVILPVNGGRIIPSVFCLYSIPESVKAAARKTAVKLITLPSGFLFFLQ